MLDEHLEARTRTKGWLSWNVDRKDLDVGGRNPIVSKQIERERVQQLSHYKAKHGLHYGLLRFNDPLGGFKCSGTHAREIQGSCGSKLQ